MMFFLNNNMNIIKITILSMLLCFTACSNENILVTLKMCRLAYLPDNTNNIKVDTIGNMFSRTFYLKFHSESDDINRWIKSSKSIKNMKPIVIDKNNKIISREKSTELFFQRLKNGTTNNTKENLNNSNMQEDLVNYHELDFKVNSCPWFDPSTIIKGRVYHIPQDKNADYGYVIIDDINNIVYVKASHS